MVALLERGLNGLFGLGGGAATSTVGAGAQTLARGGAGALGGLGLAEGIFDWGDVFFGGNTARPQHTDPATVQMHQRPAQLPGGELMDELGFRHWWLQTPDREAGMGPRGGGVPGNQIDIPGLTPTTMNDHTGESLNPGITTIPIPGADPARVDALLSEGRDTGSWVPFLNDCNHTMDDVLEDAGVDERDRPALSPLHSRHLHDVASGRSSTGENVATGLLAGGGAAAAMACPAMAPWLLGAGAAGYLSGTASQYLESRDMTSAAEGVSILGMGVSGAMLGGGIGTMIAPGVGTAIGAGIGGAVGLGAGSVMSLLGDENPDSPRVTVPGLGTTVSAEEGVGIGGMAASGALLGTVICPGLGTAIGAGVGALAGGIMALWD